jgi:hypothetical protein
MERYERPYFAQFSHNARLAPRPAELPKPRQASRCSGQLHARHHLSPRGENHLPVHDGGSGQWAACPWRSAPSTLTKWRGSTTTHRAKPDTRYCTVTCGDEVQVRFWNRHPWASRRFMLKIEVWSVVVQASSTDEVLVVRVGEHERFPRSGGCCFGSSSDQVKLGLTDFSHGPILLQDHLVIGSRVPPFTGTGCHRAAPCGRSV